MDEKHFTLDLLAGPAGFGDGLHPTTASVMDVLQELAGQGHFSRVLDMGCGSGVLAMAACCLWPECQVVAVDVQETAVVTARENITLNGLSNRIQVLHANSYRDVSIIASAPYDLVIANVTADVHVSLASQLPAVLEPGSVVILSGLLRWREHDVIELHQQQGLDLLAEPIREGEWTTVLLEKTA